MNLLELDHLVLSCAPLSQGVAFAENLFCAPMAPGGEHDAMGTHNQLLSLGSDVYFEAIAINPDAPAPGQPRWYGLDQFTGPPRLTNWAVRTPDINTALAQLPSGFGSALQLTRDDLRWQMAVPDNGILPWDGWAPALIQWGGAHPAPRLPDHRIRLKSLTLRHPKAQEIAETMAPLMPRDTALFEPADAPGLHAVFDTPNGEKTLS